MRPVPGHSIPTARRDFSFRVGNFRMGLSWVLLLLAATFMGSSARAQFTLYWDTNGSSIGAGSSPSATWNSGSTWNVLSTGSGGTTTWTAGSNAVFSAGTDATGSYTVTLSGSVSVGNITIEEGAPTFTGGTLALSNSTFNVGNSTSTATVNSAITSTTGLTKVGNGTLILGNSTNSFTGATTVNGGTLKLSVSNALSPNSALVIGTGATVDFDWGHSATIASLSGNGTLDVKGTTLVVGDSNNTTFSGVLTDSGGYGGFTKVGSGTLTLSGNNTFTGVVTISAGAVNLQNSNALGGNTYGNTISNGAALQLQNNITVNEGSFNINGSGIGGTGALRNISGNNTVTASVILASSSTIGADAGTLTITSDVNLGSSQVLTTVGAGNISLTASIYGSGSGITQAGTGTLTFSGNASNSFGGALNINSGTVVFNKSGAATATNGAAITIGDGIGSPNSATLTLLASNQIPDSSAVITINADGRFNVNNQSETINLIAGNGTLDLGTTGTLAIGVNGGNSTFGGTIAGTGTLQKLAGGTLTFNSNINFAGTLLLSGGTTLINTSTLNVGTILLAGGTLALNGNTLTVTTLRITGNSILDFGNSTASVLNATNFIIDAGITLSVTNWANTVDYFYAQNWSGATLGASGSTPANQITFSGYSNNNTSWLSYDRQISPVTPVPEPATYGAVFVALAAAVVYWRKRQAAA